VVEIGEVSTIWIYPNPFKDFVILQSDRNGVNAWVKVYDVTGRQVQSPVWWAASDRLRLDLRRMSAGMYIVDVRKGESARRMKILEE